MAWRGTARQCMARLGEAGRGRARRGRAWQGNKPAFFLFKEEVGISGWAWLGWAGRGVAGQGAARRGLNGGMKMRLGKAKCCRCQHNWIPRTTDIRICPKCNSAYWNKPRRAKPLKRDSNNTKRMGDRDDADGNG